MGGLLLIYIFRHLTIVFFFIMGLTHTNQAHATPNRYAAVVVDGATGKILHAENAYEQRHPASLVKKMALYLIFKSLKAGKITLTTHFKVSHLAARQIPCKLGLRPGNTINVEAIIKGMVTKSANDASVVVAEGIAGSLSKFVELMNKQAKELGMNSTRFFNASGVPDSRQITTAMDMAILAQALYHDFPEYCHYFQTKRFSYLGVSHNNHNHMLGKFPGLDGIKTGFVNASGFNISTSAVRYDANNKPRRLFAIVMGGTNRHNRDKRAAQLLEASFRKIGAYSVGRLSKPHTVPGTKGGIKKEEPIQSDIEEVEETESAQLDSAVDQHSPLGPTSTHMTTMNYQHVQTTPAQSNPEYAQLNNVQNGVQVTSPKPQTEIYPSSQQMLNYVKTTEESTPHVANHQTSKPSQPTGAEKTTTPLHPIEKVTIFADNSITNNRSLPENWVVPKAPIKVKSSLAPAKVSKVSSVKKVKQHHDHSTKRKALRKFRPGKRKRMTI